MEIKELVKALKDMLPPKVDYADLVCAEGFARGYTYVWEDPEPYFIEQAANMLEKLSEENKQLRNDLIMQTALAQNGQNAIENNKQLRIKEKFLLEDIRKLAVTSNYPCEYCKNYIACKHENCEQYIKGRGIEDLKGYTHDWQWSCEDFTYGECPMLENTPCNGCIKGDYKGFEYKGV